jgi:hypothetical protein
MNSTNKTRQTKDVEPNLKKKKYNEISTGNVVNNFSVWNSAGKQLATIKLSSTAKSRNAKSIQKRTCMRGSKMLRSSGVEITTIISSCYK